jgi:hypothetical protein
MAGELSIQLLDTTKTIVATVSGLDRTTMWNGSAFVGKESLDDTERAAAAISLDQMTSAAPDSTDLADYVGDFPAAITAAGVYLIVFWDTTPAPANFIGLQFHEVKASGDSAPLTLETEVDGLSLENILTALMGIMGGTSSYDITTRTITFYARDGITVVATLILGTAPGNRSSSTILGE